MRANSSDYFSSPEEIKKYLATAKEYSQENEEQSFFYLFALVALNTGARVSEALDLRHSYVLVPQRRIHISTIYDTDEKASMDRTKSKKARWVGINDSLLTEYKRHLDSTKFEGPNDLVLCDEHGKHINRRLVLRIHKRVCKLADIKVIRVHDLRHTFASHWVMNGGSLEDLKEVLGHSNISVTQNTPIYHLIIWPSKLIQCVSRLCCAPSCTSRVRNDL